MASVSVVSVVTSRIRPAGIEEEHRIGMHHGVGRFGIDRIGNAIAPRHIRQFIVAAAKPVELR